MGFMDTYEKFTCTVCGADKKEIAFDVSYLAQGKPVCTACAGKVRILYPRSFTWAQFQPDLDPDHEYNGPADDDDGFWFDPLWEMTKADFAEAQMRSDTERSTRRMKCGSAKGYFRVDNNKRIILNQGKGKKVPSKEYALEGVAELGTVPTRAVLTVIRREKTYQVTVKRVEIARGDGLATEKTDAIPEGFWGRIILDMDAPYIYPGDLLAVE